MTENRKKRTRLRWRALVADILVLLMLVLGVMPGLVQSVFRNWEGDFDGVMPGHVKSHLAFVKGHLEDDFEGYGAHQVLAPQFDIIALSHFASGFMNLAAADPSLHEEFAPYTEELVRRGLQVAPYGSDPREMSNLGDHNLYHSHLNLILGIHRHISDDDSFDEIHQRISRHLRERTMAAGNFHAISYQDLHIGQWPADQAVTLASLALFDRLNGTELSLAPINGWLSQMEVRTDPGTGLHHSAANSAIWYAPIPRGCALSWTIFYMAQFAPEEARDLFEGYRRQFGDFVLGWGGFREWPPDSDHGMNINSGPIIFGLGMAATGLGLGAARLYEDPVMYTGIMRSASTYGIPSTGLVGGRRYRSSPMIGEAMLFSGSTARHWFDEGDIAPLAEKDLPLPIGAMIFLLIVSAICMAILWHIKRLSQLPDAAGLDGEDAEGV